MKGGRLRRFAIHVLFGQLVAFLNSVTGVSTTKLVNNNASYPLLQSLTAYAFIFAVYAPIFLLLYIRNRHRRFLNFVFLQKPWRYAVLGLIDMEANFFIVKAFQYTDMISVQLLNCFNIPCVFVLSFFILKMRFAVTHIVGCLVATSGLVVLIVLDADGVTRNKVGPNVAKGDLFCLLAAALYATSNVLMEWFIK
ncbi:solute carrier family 35, member F1/2, partial [Trypanosoma cruzi]